MALAIYAAEAKHTENASSISKGNYKLYLNSNGALMMTDGTSEWTLSFGGDYDPNTTLVNFPIVSDGKVIYSSKTLVDALTNLATAIVSSTGFNPLTTLYSFPYMEGGAIVTKQQTLNDCLTNMCNYIIDNASFNPTTSEFMFPMLDHDSNNKWFVDEEETTLMHSLDSITQAITSTIFYPTDSQYNFPSIESDGSINYDFKSLLESLTSIANYSANGSSSGFDPNVNTYNLPVLDRNEVGWSVNVFETLTLNAALMKSLNNIIGGLIDPNSTIYNLPAIVPLDDTSSFVVEKNDSTLVDALTNIANTVIETAFDPYNNLYPYPSFKAGRLVYDDVSLMDSLNTIADKASQGGGGGGNGFDPNVDKFNFPIAIEEEDNEEEEEKKDNTDDDPPDPPKPKTYHWIASTDNLSLMEAMEETIKQFVNVLNNYLTVDKIKSNEELKSLLKGDKGDKGDGCDVASIIALILGSVDLAAAIYNACMESGLEARLAVLEAQQVSEEILDAVEEFSDSLSSLESISFEGESFWDRIGGWFKKLGNCLRCDRQGFEQLTQTISLQNLSTPLPLKIGEEDISFRDRLKISIDNNNSKPIPVGNFLFEDDPDADHIIDFTPLMETIEKFNNLFEELLAKTRQITSDGTSALTSLEGDLNVSNDIEALTYNGHTVEEFLEGGIDPDILDNYALKDHKHEEYLKKVPPQIESLTMKLGLKWIDQKVSGAHWSNIEYADIDGTKTYVAIGVGGSGNNKYQYSNDGGKNWQEWQMGDDSSKSYDYICFGEKHPSSKGYDVPARFVAISYGSDVAYSPNGFSWTEGKISEEHFKWKSICYGGGFFVAVGESDYNLAYSEDGENWTVSWISPVIKNWQSICYGNGLFAACSSDGYLAFSHGIDLTNWQTHERQGVSWISIAYGYDLDVKNRIEYDPTGDRIKGSNRFVCIAKDSNDVVYTYDGGQLYMYNMNVEAKEFTMMKYANGMFLAIANGTNKCVISYDGIEWFENTISEDNRDYECLCYGDNEFIVLAYNSELFVHSTVAYEVDCDGNLTVGTINGHKIEDFLETFDESVLDKYALVDHSHSEYLTEIPSTVSINSLEASSLATLPNNTTINGNKIYNSSSEWRFYNGSGYGTLTIPSSGSYTMLTSNNISSYALTSLPSNALTTSNYTSYCATSNHTHSNYLTSIPSNISVDDITQSNSGSGNYLKLHVNGIQMYGTVNSSNYTIIKAGTNSITVNGEIESSSLVVSGKTTLKNDLNVNANLYLSTNNFLFIGNAAGDLSNTDNTRWMVYNNSSNGCLIFTSPKNDGYDYPNSGFYISRLQETRRLNTTIIHNTLSEDDEIEEGCPVFATGNVYAYDINTKEYNSNKLSNTDCIAGVKSYGTWKEYLGICVAKHNIGEEIEIGDTMKTRVKMNQKTIDFATHGDCLMRSDKGNVGDIILYDGTILDDEAIITAKISKSIVGTITSRIDNKWIAVMM